MTVKLKIIYRPRRELLPYARNAMLHDGEQVAQLVASIEEFGWTSPVLIDESGEIIAGHGRILAAEQMGFDPIPTITLSGLSDAQKRAYRLADNKLPRNAGWNNDLLAAELSELQDLDFDLVSTGFTDLEISNILQTDPDIPADHWVGMPDFNQPEKAGCRKLIVHFETQIDVQDFAQLLGQKITDKTKFIWFPEQQRVKVADKAYISDESDIPAVYRE